MILIYPSQGGCVDSWHVDNFFKFQSFSWVLEGLGEAAENMEREIILNCLQQSLNHEEHHRQIRGSS